MSLDWWTLILEISGIEVLLAQRESLEELLDIIPLLDELEPTSDVYRFVLGRTDKPLRELRYDEVIKELSDEQHPD